MQERVIKARLKCLKKIRHKKLKKLVQCKVKTQTMKEYRNDLSVRCLTDKILEDIIDEALKSKKFQKKNLSVTVGVLGTTRYTPKYNTH